MAAAQGRIRCARVRVDIILESPELSAWQGRAEAEGAASVQLRAVQVQVTESSAPHVLVKENLWALPLVAR